MSGLSSEKCCDNFFLIKNMSVQNNENGQGNMCPSQGKCQGRSRNVFF